ncbi:MAG: hypothetical protein M0Z60_01160 [Nitrospiraceae bacterium]|nr:hypothetical protein [Nitrospiraceae bacterium]
MRRKTDISLPGRPFFVAAVGVLAAAVIGLFLIRKVNEWDVWFHLAIGRDILKNGGLPALDHFTLLSMGRPLHDSQWLFQVLLAAGYRTAGFWWLEAVQIGLWGLTLWFVYRAARVWANAPAAWILLTAVAIVSEERFTVRPELVTVLMIALFYWLLQQGKYRSPAGMALLICLQILWTNSHGVYVIGPFLAGCYLVAAVVSGARRRVYAEARSLGILTGALAVSTLVNPYGWEGLRFAWVLFTEVGTAASPFKNSVFEFQSPFTRSSREALVFWPYLALISAFIFSWLAAFFMRRRELSLARTLVGFGMLAVSLTARRNMPLFALVAAPLIAEQISLIGKGRIRRTVGASVVVVMAAAAMVTSPRPALDDLVNWVPYRFGVGVSSDFVPLSLPSFLARIGFSGPVFTSHTLGGFYEFFGPPGSLPFYDARFEAYDRDEIQKVFDIVDTARQRPDRWDDFVRRYGFRGLLIGHQSAEAELLPLVSSDHAWRLVYLDQAASFWMRTDRQPLPPAVDAGAIEALAAAATNYVRGDNIDCFARRAAMPQEWRLTLFARTSRFWEDPAALKDLGLMQIQAGRLGDSGRTFRRLLSFDPKSRSTLSTLAEIALRGGDRKTAEEYLLTALRYYPNDPDLRGNLAVARGTGAGDAGHSEE